MATKDEGDVLDTGDLGLLDTSKVDTTGTSPELVSINFATFEQLTAVPGIGDKVANTILSVRESCGNIDEKVIIMLTRGKLSKENLEKIDFTSNKAFPPTMIMEPEATPVKTPEPHPPKPIDMAKDTLSLVVLDPIKKIFSAKSKVVTPEPVQTPANINLASLTNDWAKMLETLKIAQAMVGKSATDAISPYSDDDLESLPAVPKHPPVTPKAQLSDSYTTLHTPDTVQNIPYTPASVRVLRIHQKPSCSFLAVKSLTAMTQTLNLISQP